MISGFIILIIFLLLVAIVVIIISSKNIAKEIKEEEIVKQKYKNLEHFDNNPITHTSITRKPSKYEVICIVSGDITLSYNVANYFRYLDNLPPIHRYSQLKNLTIEHSRVLYYFHKEGFLDSLDKEVRK